MRSTNSLRTLLLTLNTEFVHQLTYNTINWHSSLSVKKYYFSNIKNEQFDFASILTENLKYINSISKKLRKDK